MPPPKPYNGNGPTKYAVVTTIPPSKKRRKSFFEEYYYGLLAAEFVCVSLLFGAGGMGFYQGTLIGLLVTALTAVVWQFRQYSKFRGAPPPHSKPVARDPVVAAAEKSGLQPIRPAKRAPAPVGPDGKKKFPPSYFPPLRD